jgi:hypothetical protein
MRLRFSLAVVVAVLGLLTVAGTTSTLRAQDYYNGNAYYGNGYDANAAGTFNSNYAFGPAYGYGPYGAETQAPYATGYVYQPNAYPYYGNYYYGAYPAYGYVYGGPILYGRFGRGGRVGYRFGWW